MATQSELELGNDIREMLRNQLDHVSKQIEELAPRMAALNERRDRIKAALYAYDAPSSLSSQINGKRKMPTNATGRAPRGSNVQAIIKDIRNHPGSTAAEIAAETGIHVSVVYSATSRLVTAGRIVREPLRDRKVGYRLP